MKKIIVILLSVVLVFGLASCGKIAEKAIEKAIEKESGGKVDVNKDGVTVKDDEGNEATFGGTKWPDGEIGKLIPEFKDGKITFVMNSEEGAMITIEEVSQKEYEAYLNKIKNAGYTKDSFNSSSDDSYMYSAVNDKGDNCALTYTTEDEIMNIIITIHTAE